ncbi:trans-sialidase, partial [Trypanosoma cruzi]
DEGLWGGAHISFPLVLLSFAARAGRHPQCHTHTATPCRRVFLLFCFRFVLFFVDRCVLPPCVIVEVGAVPHVPLPSSCASCCADDVPPCAPFFSFSSLPANTRKYLHSALHDCFGNRRALACVPCWNDDVAARCPLCVKVLTALGDILLSSLYLHCRVRALLGVCWRVTDGATMASSDDDSRCALGTHPHTLPCLSVGVIAAGHCCERDGDHDGVTPREGPVHCQLWSGEAVCLQPD